VRQLSRDRVVDFDFDFDFNDPFLRSSFSSFSFFTNQTSLSVPIPGREANDVFAKENVVSIAA
jgi:hypothetical protein